MYIVHISKRILCKILIYYKKRTTTYISSETLSNYRKKLYENEKKGEPKENKKL